MKRVFFPIALVATIILGGVLAYSLWQATPLTSKQYFESGKKYYGEKKYQEATIQLLNAVRGDARNRDARFLLALSFLNQQDLNRAVAQLGALLEYYPDDVDAILQLGGIYLTGGRNNPDLFRQAQELAAKVLSKEPTNVAALVLSGNASAGLQDYRTSVDLFEKALGLDPQNLPAFVSLGTTQALQKNFAEAEQAFLKARAVSPQDKTALISLANFYRAVRAPDKAEAVFKEAVSIYPKDWAIYLQVVGFYNQQNRFEDVEKVLREAQVNSPDTPEPSLLLSDFYTSKDRKAESRNLLLELKEKFPANIDVAAKLVLSIIMDQPDRARKEVDQILKAEPRNPVGHLLLGELQFFAGQYDAAEATFNREVVLQSQFPQVHFFLGNMATRKGQIDQALDHYQKSLAVNSRYVPSRVALAEVFLNKGRIADSEEEVRKALEVRPDFVPARLLKAAIDKTQKDFSGVEEELAALAKDAPNNALVYRQMAVYDESRGRTADAEKNLLHALQLQPDSQQMLRDITILYIRSKQYDKAIQRINLTPEDKKLAVHYELLGLVYSYAGKSREAEAAYKKALEEDKGNSSADSYLFAEYMRTGRVNEGLNLMDEMIAKNPANAGAHAIKAQLYERQGKLNEARQSYEQALKLNPDQGAVANNLAYMMAEEGTDLAGALGYAQTARKNLPENAGVADTLGWIYYKLGNHVLAREQVQFAVSKEPGNGIFQYHLGMIYRANKQVAEATSALRKAANSQQDFKEKSLAQAALKDLSQ